VRQRGHWKEKERRLKAYIRTYEPLRDSYGLSERDREQWAGFVEQARRAARLADRKARQARKREK
jgi:hypothetical protein